MPHLLYVLPYLEKGGTEKHALALLDRFRHNYHVSLLAPTGATAYQFAALGIPHWQFCRWDQNFFRGFWEVKQSVATIAKQKPIDLVHVHGAHELMLAVHWFLPQVPIVFTVHGYHGDSAGFSYWSSAWMANWGADRVIGVCSAEREKLVNYGLFPHKITIIHNGVDPSPPTPEAIAAARQRWQLPTDRCILGTVARLTAAKGLLYLLEAFANLVQEMENIHLVIAGEGEQESMLRQFISDRELDGYVTFTGYTDHLAALMTHFDIFVLPSLQEAFSLACLEAMALKKPIVATQVGGFPEQIISGETGLLVPPQNVDALQESLAQLITTPALRSAFSEKSYQRYLAHFTEEVMISKTNQIYQDLL